MVRLKPFCVSDQSMLLDYYLLVEKMSTGSTSLSRQVGKAELAPLEEKDLGSVTIKLGAHDRCRVQLKVMAQGRLVADEDYWLRPSDRCGRARGRSWHEGHQPLPFPVRPAERAGEGPSPAPWWRTSSAP